MWVPLFCRRLRIFDLVFVRVQVFPRFGGVAGGRERVPGFIVSAWRWPTSELILVSTMSCDL